MTLPAASDTLLTLPQVAEALQVTRRTVDRLIARRELPPPVKIGRCSRVPASDLSAYIQRQKDSRPS